MVVIFVFAVLGFIALQNYQIPSDYEKKSVEVKEENKEEYTIISGEEAIPKTEQPTFTWPLYYPSDDLWISGDPKAPEDSPWLELRFQKSSQSGEMVPCRIDALIFHIWFDEPPYEGPAPVFTVSFRNGQDPLIGGQAVRIPLSSNIEKDNFRGLSMGESYFVTAQKRPRENIDYGYVENIGRFILKTPEHVPPGKLAKMDIDVTQQFNPWDQTEEITVRVKEELPKLVEMYYNVPEKSERQNPSILKDGNFLIKADKMGGELLIATFRIGVGGAPIMEPLYYKKSVEDTEVVFPDEADFTHDSESRISFRLKVPYEKLDDNQDYMGIGLFMFRYSHFPLVMNCVWPRDREKLSYSLPESVNLSIIPGKYYVGYVHEEVETIGLIEIKPEDEGQTLEMIPLVD